MIYNRLADIATINDISNINEINNRTFLRSIKKLNSSKIIAVAGREPFNNQNIINAILGFSLIRNKIAYSVFNEYAQTEINILPSYSLYYRKLEHIFFYNPDEVKNHIKKTGVEKINFVLDLPINITRFNRGIDHWKNELSKFDIKMKVNKEQQESIINKINKNDFQAALIVVDDFMIHPRDILIFYETFSSDDAKKRLLPDETLNYINNAITINNVARRNLNYFRAFENFAQNSRILGVITLPSYYLTTDNVQNIDDLLIGKFDKVRVYR
jgi:hypothetical protein